MAAAQDGNVIAISSGPAINISTNALATINISNLLICSTNYSSPFNLQPEEWSNTQNHQPTNVVVKTNYVGTIQVGDRFYRLNDCTNFIVTKELR